MSEKPEKNVLDISDEKNTLIIKTFIGVTYGCQHYKWLIEFQTHKHKRDL